LLHLLCTRNLPLPAKRCEQRLYGTGRKAGTGTAATVIDYTQVQEEAASQRVGSG